MYRQGDVLIIPVDELDDAPVNISYLMQQMPMTSNVLVAGETTGHAHRVEGPSFAIYGFGDVPQLIRADAEIDIVHEEHDTIRLPAGKYFVRRQREALDGDGSTQSLVYD